MGMWVSSEKLPMISTVASRKGNQMYAGPLEAAEATAGLWHCFHDFLWPC